MFALLLIPSSSHRCFCALQRPGSPVLQVSAPSQALCGIVLILFPVTMLAIFAQPPAVHQVLPYKHAQVHTSRLQMKPYIKRLEAECQTSVLRMCSMSLRTLTCAHAVGITRLQLCKRQLFDCCSMKIQQSPVTRSASAGSP